MKIKSLIGSVLLAATFVSGAYAEVTTGQENANVQNPKKKEYRVRLPGGDTVFVQNAPDDQTATGTPPATAGAALLSKPILTPVMPATKSLTLAPLPPVAPTTPSVPLKLMNPPPVLTVNPVLPVVPVVPVVPPVVAPPVITVLPILPVITPPPVPVIVIPPPPVVMLPPPVVQIPIVYIPPPRIQPKTLAIK